MDPKGILAVVLVLVAVSAVLWSFLSSKSAGSLDGVGFYASTGTQFSVNVDVKAYTFADGLLFDLVDGKHCDIDDNQTFTWTVSTTEKWVGSARFVVMRMLTESGTDLYILTHGQKYATLDVSASDGLKWVPGPPGLDVDPQTLPVVLPTVLDVPSYVVDDDGGVTYAVRLIGTDPARYALINPETGCLIPDDSTRDAFTEFGLINGLLYPWTDTQWYFVRNSKARSVTKTEDGSIADNILTDVPLLNPVNDFRVFDVYTTDQNRYVVGVRTVASEVIMYYEMSDADFKVLQPKIHEAVLSDTIRLTDLNVDRAMADAFINLYDGIDGDAAL
jgi:hypothetical protein